VGRRGIVILSVIALCAVAAPASAAPANDDFADAQRLLGAMGSVRGTTRGATTETAASGSTCEPTQPAGGGRSVWYRWTAPASGNVRMRVRSDANHYLSAWKSRGGCWGVDGYALAAWSSANRPKVDFEVVRGKRYWISVYNDAAAFRLQWRFLRAPRPAHDAFSRAKPISGRLGALWNEPVAGATRQPGEPRHAGRGGHSVWYRWKAPATGRAVFDTQLYHFDTTLAVYTGSRIGRLSRVAANDDARADGASRVQFRATAGTTYRIALSTVPSVEMAPSEVLQLFWHSGPAPPNDRFGAAQTLPSRPRPMQGWTSGAGMQPGEPSHGARRPGASVWFKWRAPRSGYGYWTAYDFGYQPMYEFTKIAVYTGSSVDSLKRISTKQTWSGEHNLSFNFVKGRTYYFAFAGEWQRAGSYYTLLSVPYVNDAFAAATAITGPAGTSLSSPWQASVEPGEPQVDGKDPVRTMWWTWTAPASAAVTFDTVRSSDLMSLAVFKGSTLPGLQRVGSNTGCPDGPTPSSCVTFNAVAGTTYKIVVDSPWHETGAARLSWRTGGARDTTPPTVELSWPATNAVVSGATDFQVDTADASGIADARLHLARQWIATDTSHPFGARVDTSLYGDGWYLVTVVATDRAGYETRIDDSVILDNRRPIPSIDGPRGTVATRRATLTWNANEPVTRARCSLDGAAYSRCPQPVEYRGLSDGRHVMRYQVRDKGGTWSLPEAAVWAVDTRPVIP
jgi:hypothetical protein